MSRGNSNNSGGVGFVGLLQVALIVLKLLDQINWSWWWVLTPTWGSVLLVVLIVLVLTAIKVFGKR